MDSVTGHIGEEEQTAAPLREPPLSCFTLLAPILAGGASNGERQRPGDVMQHNAVADGGLFTCEHPAQGSGSP